MKVSVTDIYSQKTATFSGTSEELGKWIIVNYPYVYEAAHGSRNPDVLLRVLGKMQRFSVSVYPEIDVAKTEPDNGMVAGMLGYYSILHSNLEAAKFLSGKKDVDLVELRNAMVRADEDPEKAALIAVGFQPTDDNLTALRAVRQTFAATQEMKKSDSVDPVASKSVEPVFVEEKAIADAVRRAFDDQTVLPVTLGGKHTQGSMLGRDPKTGGAFILKTGSGAQNPASGLSESPVSQSRRESAFSDVVRFLGIGRWFSSAKLLRIDGKEYTVIGLLPWTYLTVQQLKSRDPLTAERALWSYVPDGTIYRWGVVDFVLGNVDRHSGNMMIHSGTGKIRLIDHGSTFSGNAFDPASDSSTFVPYYFRMFLGPLAQYKTPTDAVAKAPKLSDAESTNLRVWMESIDIYAVSEIVRKYGIDPAPVVRRYHELLSKMRTMRPEDAVVSVWLTRRTELPKV